MPAFMYRLHAKPAKQQKKQKERQADELFYDVSHSKIEISSGGHGVTALPQQRIKRFQFSAYDVRRFAATAVATERVFATQATRWKERFFGEPQPVRMAGHLLKFPPVQQTVFRMIAHPNVPRRVDHEKPDGGTA